MPKRVRNTAKCNHTASATLAHTPTPGSNHGNKHRARQGAAGDPEKGEQWQWQSLEGKERKPTLPEMDCPNVGTLEGLPAIRSDIPCRAQAVSSQPFGSHRDRVSDHRHCDKPSCLLDNTDTESRSSPRIFGGSSNWSALLPVQPQGTVASPNSHLCGCQRPNPINIQTAYASRSSRPRRKHGERGIKVFVISVGVNDGPELFAWPKLLSRIESRPYHRDAPDSLSRFGVR
ncbi:hypothetical protein CDEST_03600 [Colletotrichum destructivum]|uniref:Uncharacterized protein n=1 Tax=Colletotrichum destructivum TaxID=34406 RepID=A0AAX4I5X2_9PEZI|nr:hypothetical protein CDEST_03600 [Colletotrichum destructivum]